MPARVLIRNQLVFSIYLLELFLGKPEQQPTRRELPHDHPKGKRHVNDPGFTKFT
jgi:hypothetical protein